MGKSRLLVLSLCEDHGGERSLASPGARSSSPSHWTVTVGYDGVAEFLLKEEIKEQMPANDHSFRQQAYTSTCPSVLFMDTAFTFTSTWLA